MDRGRMTAASLAACLAAIVVFACSPHATAPAGHSPRPFPEQVAAPPYHILVEGQPDPKLLTVRGGVYVWKAGLRWHVRIAKSLSPPARGFRDPVYEGAVIVENGVVSDVVRRNADLSNDLRFMLNEIFFRFEPQNPVEGFDFAVQQAGPGGYCVLIDVRADGIPNPGILRLGRSMHLVTRTPLRVCFL